MQVSLNKNGSGMRWRFTTSHCLSLLHGAPFGGWHCRWRKPVSRLERFQVAMRDVAKDCKRTSWEISMLHHQIMLVQDNSFRNELCSIMMLNMIFVSGRMRKMVQRYGHGPGFYSSWMFLAPSFPNNSFRFFCSSRNASFAGDMDCHWNVSNFWGPNKTGSALGFYTSKHVFYHVLPWYFMVLWRFLNSETPRKLQHTPRAHKRQSPVRQLWKESLYSPLVKVWGCVPKVCWNNLRERHQTSGQKHAAWPSSWGEVKGYPMPRTAERYSVSSILLRQSRL